MASFRKLRELRQRAFASDYARQFRQIALPLGWDDKALMAHFYEGLKDDVKDIHCMRD